MKALTRKLQPSRNLTNRFNSRVIRLTTILLVTALLTPIVNLGGERKVSAGSNLPVMNPPAPVAASSEAFAYSSSNTLTNTVLASIVAANQSLTDGYHSVSNLVVSPALPEGFAMAKVPTVWENVSGLVSSFASSYVSPLLFAPSTATTAPPAPPVLLAQGTTRFDFDGDGKADPSRWQPTTSEWRIKESLSNSISILNQGISTAKITPADYDGDGITDRAVFESSTGIWRIKPSSGGAEQTVTGFGQYGDKPVSGDYIGDHKAEVAFWRPSDNTWHVKEVISGGATETRVFGATGDIPVAGNYDTDNKMDYAVFRPSTGAWHTLLSGSSYSSGYHSWGASGDTPVPGDYDGDGRTDYAVYRPSNGTWYAYSSYTNNGLYLSKAWGNYGDQPVPADYDADGKDDFAVWRPTTGVWYIVKSSNPTLEEYAYETLGQASDVAAPAAYIKQIGGQVAAQGLAKARLAPKNQTGGTDLYSRNFGWGTGLVNLPGRAGLDAGFGISYNSLVWTKQSGVMIFDADNSNVSPGFRFGYPTIEPSYFDRDTGKFAYLMVTPSGKRVEFRQEAASNIYETADSSYTQLTFSVRLLGEQGQPPPVDDGTLTVTTTDGTQMTYLWKAGAFRCSQIKDRNGNFVTVNHDDYGLLKSVTDTLGRVININYDSQHYPTSITQTWKSNNGEGTDTTHTYATFTYANSPAIATNFVEAAPTSTAIPVIGPPNGTSLKVLQKITYATGGTLTSSGYTTFEYNDYAQVEKINNYAADQQLLNSVRTDLGALGTMAQSDCPRFSITYTKIKDFNGGVETVVRNTFAENQNFSIDNETGAATKDEESMDNHPHDLISRQWYHSPGNWSEGLPLASEDLVGGVRKRWTRTGWTHDNISLTYILNPRVTELKVGDETNVKRTEIKYHPIAPGSPVAFYGLVSEVKLYDGTPGTLLKRAMSDYVLDTAYTSRRIIGLPRQSELYDGSGSLMSKVTYDYDQYNFGDSELEQNISSVIQHDNTNYGASFITGRGNLTTTTRHDVTNPSTVSSIVKYNTAGAPVAQIAPGATAATTRQVKVSYLDSFSDGMNNRNTFAYPTGITTAGTEDTGDITSYVTYRFDIGANVKAESPNSDGEEREGKATTRVFDSVGRLERETIVNNGSYTRYEYAPSQTLITAYAALTEGQGETKAETYTDGGGRTIKSRSAFSWSGANVSTWSAQITEYDIMGRMKRQTPPTEITSSWQPTNEDNRGTNVWLWTSQDYDWKGRVLLTTNTDGTTQEASYEGCGCAGGEIVTLKSEQIVEKDWQGNLINSLGRRTQKIYSDVLGRNYKTEIYNWNGTGLPYTTKVNTFDGRDQVTLSRQYEGAEGSSVFQETVMSYDGHGRLKTQHLPEQDADKAMLFDYNPDDSLEKKTDARGVVSNYTYNERGLLAQISYDVPPVTSSPPYIVYVARAANSNNYAVNGLKISGGRFGEDTTVVVGTINYIAGAPPQFIELARYNNEQLTRGTEYDRETVTFIDPGNIDYSYTGGKYAEIINNSSGKTSEKIMLQSAPSSGGQLFFGSGDFYGIPQTPTVNYEYDALGNRKAMIDAVGRIDYKYNDLSGLESENRHFNNITNASSDDGNYKLSYEYTISGALKSITDPFNARINYAVDKIGRTTAVTGAVAYAGETNYATELQYRAWGAGKHLKYGNDSVLNVEYNTNLNPSQYDLLNETGTSLMKAEYKYYGDGQLQFVNDLGNDRFDRSYNFDHVGRLTSAQSGYVANGQPYSTSTTGPYGLNYGQNSFNNLTSRHNQYWYSANQPSFTTTYVKNRSQNPGWIYDSDGRLININKALSSSLEQTTQFAYDASGRRVNGVNDGDGQQIKSSIYYVRSSVLGGAVISEVSAEGGVANFSGRKLSTYVYFAGQLIAEQTTNGLYAQTQTEVIVWKQRDPLNTSVYNSAGQAALDPNGIATDAPNYNNLSQYPNYYSQHYNSYNYGRTYNPWEGTGYGSSSSYSNGGGAGGMPGSPTICTVDGGTVPCGIISSHEASPCPNNNCSPQYITRNHPYSPYPGYVPQSSGFFFPRAHADGKIGYWGTIEKSNWLVGENEERLSIETHRESIFLEFPSLVSYWLFRGTHPIPPGGTGGVLITGGGGGNTPSTDPCAGQIKGKINPNVAGYPGEGIDHVSDRHISPQTPNWIGKKSYFEFGSLFTKGQPSYTKDQRKDIVMAMFQEAFEKGAANRLGGGDYAYSYAPYVPLASGAFRIDFIGRDNRRNDDTTNVRTVILDVTDCANPILSTGYPGLARPNDRVFGVPTWVPRTWTIPF